MDKNAPYTVAEAGKVLGATAQQIYAMVQKGELERFEVRGRAALVTRKSVDAAKRRK